MLSRRHRFHGHNSLRFTYTEGKTVRGPLFAVKYVQNSRRRHYRAAVVVSKKVHKSALVRNRIRRRLYEALRRNGQHFTGTFDIIITVFHDSVADMPHEELRRSLVSQLRKAGILDRKADV